LPTSKPAAPPARLGDRGDPAAALAFGGEQVHAANREHVAARRADADGVHTLGLGGREYGLDGRLGHRDEGAGLGLGQEHLVVADAVAAGGPSHVEDAADAEAQRGVDEGLQETTIGQVVCGAHEGSAVWAVGGAQCAHDVTEGNLGLQVDLGR